MSRAQRLRPAASWALAAALAAAAGAAASADELAVQAPSTAHYRVVDADGMPVGELVVDRGDVRFRITALARRRPNLPAAPERPEPRPFAPDYANALTPDQMTAAWERELARVFPQPVTGGG